MFSSKIKKLSIFIFIVSVMTVTAQSQAAERILSFHSDINVSQDGSMAVTETIKVVSAGNQIKRGIYRDFPTRYTDKLGNAYEIDFNVVKVLRNGAPESYHFQNMSNGKRVYIGKKNVLLSPGEYTYTITYTTNRQLGFFKDHDELYWNVTGNGWAFPIDEASAAVKLPPGASAEILNMDGYTGRSGSKEKSLSVSRDMFGNAIFTTTRPLAAGEGLTIAVAWPKGYVAEPTPVMKSKYFIKDNAGVIVGAVGLLILLAYYIIVWARIGKDPAKGTVIPLYNPPAKLSPAAMRYIMRTSYDNKTFTAAIINMAVRGYITIDEKDGVYTISKTGIKEPVLAQEELVIAKELLKSKNNIKLKNENHMRIRAAIVNLQNALRENFEKVYFLSNFGYFVPGLVFSGIIVVACAALMSTEKIPIAVFISVWLTVWSFAIAALLQQATSRWKSFFHGGSNRLFSLGGALSTSIFALPFLVGEIFGICIFVYAVSVSAAVIMAIAVLMNLLFYHLLKAPTIKGRKVMDQIEGFRMYLSVAEKERLNLINPPQETPELFERYLPYALALDVEQAWAERFSDVLARASERGEPYSPGWYSGGAWDASRTAGFASSLNSSFSSAISSSSTAPGSSSGFGGGGSSGGGGGGGGGGGW